MPARRTIRGAQRTPIDGRYDAIICGASFAGLAAARELAGARAPDGRPAKVLMLDRYEIGERQTSACATPTAWLDVLGIRGSMLQEFGSLHVHTPHASTEIDLPFTFATFDYPLLCSLMGEHSDAQFEIATVTGRAERDAPAHANGPITVVTDRGEVSAPLVVDALGWRRVLGHDGYQPPDAPLSRGLEVHPAGSAAKLEVWVDRTLVPEGYGWSFPAADEVRVGVGSFDPNYHVREPTEQLSRQLDRPTDGYQGNWIPHKLRDATDDGVFFAGDSAGHCLPLTAEGIRTAFYFGIACGRELRRVVEGRGSRDTALRRYSRFSAQYSRQFELLLLLQQRLPKVEIRTLTAAIRIASHRRITAWAFKRYLNVAHPSYAGPIRSEPRVPFPRSEATPRAIASA